MERLDALAVRIERIALDPSQIERQTFFRVAKPLFALTRWRARVRHRALDALVVALRQLGSSDRADLAASDALEAAVSELEANVDVVERVAILKKRAPVAHAAWLDRVLQHLRTAHAALHADAEATKEGAKRLAKRRDASGVLPPLTRARDPDAQPDSGSIEVPVDEVTDADLDDTRVLELELAAIDHVLAAARAEKRVLGRKRRLLIAARQRLLDAAAALPLEPTGVRARREHIAREIARADRLQGAGVDPDVGLVHQARQALARGDRRRLSATLAAIDAAALAEGDARVASVAGRALAALWRGEDPEDSRQIMRSLRASAVDMLGAGIVEEVERSVDKARSRAETTVAIGTPSEKEDAEDVLRRLPEEAAAQVARAAVAVDGLFEVGGALTPLRVTEEERFLRRVRFPTQDLLLVRAEEVHDLYDAVLTDPRTVLLDLATGRLLARRFVREEVKLKRRTVMRGEVRVYVLDGSGSMKGPRARVRDALLVAELATLVQRLEAPGEIRCTLLYRYFDELLGDVKRITTADAAKSAIQDVVATVRTGGTDIQLALLASLEQIAEAREADPDLARAQIVLVTDGKAPVEEEPIAAARARTKGLPIGISVIALGEENPALRALVARQRAAGERAFYHYLDDAELESITSGMLDLGGAIHPPEEAPRLRKEPPRSPAAIAADLEVDVGDLVTELEALERARDQAGLEQLEHEREARRELGLREDEAAAEGARARAEAFHRDKVALDARYARWFPAIGQTSSGPLPRGEAHEDVEAAAFALLAVSEVVDLLGGTELTRRADAIEIFERLLPDARLTPARYRAVLEERRDALGPALAALHTAVRGRAEP